MKALRYLFLLFLLSLYSFAFSQRQHIRFEHIGTDKGLSQSNVICIFQDSRGFMWFGTRDGLNKYDGYKFTVYQYDENNPNSLIHNAINDITEDADGNLWIASWGGLNMFDRSKERFVRFKSDTTSSAGVSNININKLLIDSEENLWIGTNGGGLNMYDKKNNRFVYYLHDAAKPGSLAMDNVKDIVEDDQHKLWIATDAGLDMFDKTTKTFTHFRHNEKEKGSICSDICWDLFIDKQHQLWIGTNGGGLDLFDRQKNEFIHFKDELARNNNLSSNVIRTLNEDDNGNLWIGIENGGISIFNIQTKTFENYSHDEIDNRSLSNNSIWSLYNDNKGNMWVGTFSGGINLVNKDANKFIHYRHTSLPFSLNNNSVLSILEDSKRNLWIGTDGGGLDLFDREKDSFSHYTHKADNANSICGNYVLKVFEDSRGELWIGTWGNGLSIFNKERNSFRYFKYNPLNPKGIPSPNVWTIGEDPDKNVWIGTYGGGGASRYDRKNNSFINYFNNPADSTSLANNTINIFFTDRDGKFWIGTNGGGLDLFNKQTNSFTHFKYKENKNGLSNNDIYCIAEDNAGNLWIGTKVGLNRMDKKTGGITNYFIKDGLPSNTISGILIDEKGNLWISTFNGLSRFDPINKIFKNFGVGDGLQSNEFKTNSCFKSRTGKMFFGGINGFNEFYPDSINEKIFDLPLVFTNFQIFNKQILISADDNRSPLKTNITDTKEIVLSYNQSVISFEFASLNYAAQGKTQYSYMLEGFDKDWNDVGTQHIATYTNLDPGKYVFKVKGLNNEGEWSSNIKSIELTITPPFWLTWWFKSAVVLIILGGVYAFYKFRINIIKSQKRKLEQRVQEQTQELVKSTADEQRARKEAEQANIDLERKSKEMEEFAYIASHDLREPLRTTSGFVKLLQKQYQGKFDEKSETYFNYILEASDRMKLLINNLLEYSQIGKKKELQQVNCDDILQKLLADLGVAITEAGAEITYDPLPTIGGYPIEMKQLFQNLVTNAIKFSKKDTPPKVHIGAKLVNEEWQFTVSDNGIGIDEKYAEKIFIIFQRLNAQSEYKGSGIGLSHCKKIVEMHHGRIWVESAPGYGSTFYFTTQAPKDKTYEPGKLKMHLADR